MGDPFYRDSRFEEFGDACSEHCLQQEEFSSTFAKVDGDALSQVASWRTKRRPPEDRARPKLTPDELKLLGPRARALLENGPRRAAPDAPPSPQPDAGNAAAAGSGSGRVGEAALRDRVRNRLQEKLFGDEAKEKAFAKAEGKRAAQQRGQGEAEPEGAGGPEQSAAAQAAPVSASLQTAQATAAAAAAEVAAAAAVMWQPPHQPSSDDAAARLDPLYW